MLNKFKFFKKRTHQERVEHIVKDAQKACKELFERELAHLNIHGYGYAPKEAVEELGLDEELVHELVEDYVAQIIKASTQFAKQIDALRLAKEEKRELDYTALKDLIHKNLGVARNLRIKDAHILLYEMMTSDDLEYLEVCVKALRVCAIQLKPERAYKTIKLIEVKSSLEN